MVGQTGIWLPLDVVAHVQLPVICHQTPDTTPVAHTTTVPTLTAVAPAADGGALAQDDLHLLLCGLTPIKSGPLSTFTV